MQNINNIGDNSNTNQGIRIIDGKTCENVNNNINAIGGNSINNINNSGDKNINTIALIVEARTSTPTTLIPR